MEEIHKKIDIKSLEERLQYSFDDTDILLEALTHTSYVNEYKKAKLKYNERLEFLGDSVLGISMSDYLYRKFPDYPEGELTKIRAAVVSETPLYQAALELGLGEFLLLGKGEESTGGRKRASVLADALEAVIGAIYLDGGLEEAKSFVRRILIPTVNDVVQGKGFHDYKTELQELIQKENCGKISYTIIDEKGPEHDKIFTTRVCCGNKVLGTGRGKSKKESEQNAAKNALIKISD